MEIDDELAAASIGSSVGSREQSSSAGETRARAPCPRIPPQAPTPRSKPGMAIGEISGNEYYSGDR